MSKEGHVTLSKGRHVTLSKGGHVTLSKGGHVTLSKGGHVTLSKGGHVTLLLCLREDMLQRTFYSVLQVCPARRKVSWSGLAVGYTSSSW